MLGTSIFSAFEAETPAWRKLAKWLTMTLVTLIPYRFVGHWALLFPATIGATGLVVHWWYCRRHQIHPLHVVWGLTVAVEPPELETRVAILMKKAEIEHICHAAFALLPASRLAVADAVVAIRLGPVSSLSRGRISRDGSDPIFGWCAPESAANEVEHQHGNQRCANPAALLSRLTRAYE